MGAASSSSRNTDEKKAQAQYISEIDGQKIYYVTHIVKVSLTRTLANTDINKKRQLSENLLSASTIPPFFRLYLTFLLISTPIPCN